MSSSDPIIDRRATFYMLLLALQFGIQPILTRRFTPDDINKSTVVLVQEIVKFWMAFAMLYLSGSVKSAFKGKLLLLMFLGTTFVDVFVYLSICLLTRSLIISLEH